MSSQGESLSAKVQSAYQQLSAVASELNAVSDELGKSISDLDASLKKLNLGVEQWVEVRGNDDPQTGDHWEEELGYAKVNGKWGIALRTVEGNYNWPDQDHFETWLFNEGPRELRLSAIGFIPELLAKLSEEATSMAKKVKAKLAEAQEVAKAVKQASEPKRPPQPKPTGGAK